MIIKMSIIINLMLISDFIVKVITVEDDAFLYTYIH
jgi:hypothetical protein